MIKQAAKNQTSQSWAFVEAAREAGCSEDESVFDANLKKIARHKLKQVPKQTQHKAAQD